MSCSQTSKICATCGKPFDGSTARMSFLCNTCFYLWLSKANHDVRSLLNKPLDPTPSKAIGQGCTEMSQRKCDKCGAPVSAHFKGLVPLCDECCKNAFRKEETRSPGHCAECGKRVASEDDLEDCEVAFRICEECHARIGMDNAAAQEHFKAQRSEHADKPREPKAPPEAPKAPEPAKAESNLPKRLLPLTIMVVDPSEQHRSDLKAILQQLGHSVLTYERAIDACMDFYEVRPDMIMCYEFGTIPAWKVAKGLLNPASKSLRAGALRPYFLVMRTANPPSNPTITTNELQRNKALCEEFGVNQFVWKPFTMDDLIRFISEASIYKQEQQREKTLSQAAKVLDECCKMDEELKPGTKPKAKKPRKSKRNKALPSELEGT